MKFLKDKRFIISLSVVLTLVLIYFMFRAEINQYLGIGTDKVLAPGTQLDENKVLKKGTGSLSSPSMEVIQLQTWLKRDGAENLVIDGVFGTKTEGALNMLKGVKEVTLKAYPTIATIPVNGN